MAENCFHHTIQGAEMIWHDQLLQTKSFERNICSIRYQTQVVRFPIQCFLQGFELSVTNALLDRLPHY